MMIRARPPLFDTGMSKSRFLAFGKEFPISAPVLYKAEALLVVVDTILFERPNAEEVVDPTIAKTLLNELRKIILFIQSYLLSS